MSRIRLKTINCIFYVFSLALVITILLPVSNVFGSPSRITTKAATNITATSATLNGNISDDSGASVSFEWGITTGYGNTTADQTMGKKGKGDFSADLTNLSPNTVYHFRAKAVNKGTAYGSDQFFTTSNIPLTVVTGTASNITDTGATLSGNLIAKGNATSVMVSFEYGTTTSYGNTVEGMPPTLTDAGAFTANLIGLVPHTLYHFRARAVGATTNYGSDATFSVLTTTPPGGSEGSVPGTNVTGGGGAPTPVANTVTVTGLISEASWMIDNSGVVLDTIKLKTADDYVSINIERGTTLLDINGQALKTLTANSQLSPPLPPETSALLFSYEFGPSDAQFIPSITLSYKYNSQILPAEVDINTLYIASWDGKNWRKLDTQTNATTNTVSTQITGFGQYALMSNLPASFTFTTFSITPSLSQVGDVVDIAVTCINVGGSRGDYPVILRMNNVEKDRKVITLNPGDSQVALFQVTKSIPGTYTVDINNLTSEFTVQPALNETPIQLRIIIVGFALLIIVIILVIISLIPTQESSKKDF